MRHAGLLTSRRAVHRCRAALSMREHFGLALCTCETHALFSMAERTGSAAKRLEIKKYPNRRYYDATHSRHLTLDEIRALVQQGYDIRVIDARTSADITAQVL